MKQHRRNIIAITGSNSGLGAALVRMFENEPRTHIIKLPGPDAMGFDFTRPEHVFEAARVVRSTTETILEFEGLEPDDVYRVLINCAGVNYIEWFDQADWAQYDRLQAINVTAPMMLIQHLIGLKPPMGDPVDDNWFNGSGAVLNIISNASHMPMTNSAFYNATKGALHIATLALARELRKTHGLCVFGISPNKLKDTGMSAYIEGRVPSLRGWTPEQAAAYQIGALPAGEETDPMQLAEFIAYLLTVPERHKYLTNTVIPYGA